MDKHDKPDELQHHGVKGMRWGVRRTPEQLGHKPTGPKKKKKTVAKKAEVKRKPSVKDMSDEDLRKAIDRARMEDTYKQLRPDNEAKAKEFLGEVVGKVVVPAAMNSGKRYLENALNKFADKTLQSELDRLKEEESTLSLKDKLNKLKNRETDEYEKLKKEYDIIDIKKKIEERKANTVDDAQNWENRSKKLAYEQNLRKDQKKQLDDEVDFDRAKTATDSSSESSSSNTTKRNNETFSKMFTEAAKTAYDGAKKAFTSTKPIVTEPSSKHDFGPDKSSKPDIIIDMDASDIVSTMFDSSSSSGGSSSSVSNLLSAPPARELISAGSSWIQETFIDD